eukprot:TRINITY_DN1558_c0_g1_i2.p2 TRINITY_DN1558_c0_g1~~TRINITY_DN1558_c0_g1_i2.p2  ORF type:complete len:203 (+),score=60.64 TRINITY_DN1558_c0_g1_i2:79-609(+)
MPASKLISLFAGLLVSRASDVGLDAALASEDECRTEGCAVNALQVRAGEVSEALEAKELVEFMAGGLDTECSGSGSLSAGTCYTGAFLAFKFKLEVKSFSSGKGSIDMFATGPQDKQCLDHGVSMSGEAIEVGDLSTCGLPAGIKYNVDYCANQDEIQVHITSPLTLTLALKKADC